MKPIFSEQQRNEAVKQFITGRYNGITKIRGYSKIVSYLNNSNIKLLIKIAPIGSETILDEIGATKFYTEWDAESYVNWLVGVVTGASRKSEEIVEQANNQLFKLILCLRDDIETSKQIPFVAPYDWEDRFSAFEKKLDDSKKSMESRNEKITEMLSKIFEWMKEYRPILDEVKKRLWR